MIFMRRRKSTGSVKSSKNYSTTARLRRALASAFHSSRNKKLKIASLQLPRPPLPFHL